MEGGEQRIERIDFKGARLLGIAVRDATDRDQELAVPEEEKRIAWFDMQRLFDQRFALSPAAEILAFKGGEHGIGLSHAGIAAERAFGGFASVFDKACAIGAGQAQDFELYGG